MWGSAWNRLMGRQELLLLSAVTTVVLFSVVTIPTDIQHALSSHRPLSWLVSTVVYAALVAHRQFPFGTAAVTVIGSVVLMAEGMAYPLTLPAVFYVLYSVALKAGPGRTLAVGVPVKATLLCASLITHPGITGFVVLLWAALAVTSGSASRSHRGYVAEVEKRARRAEQAREDEANRRVTEERLRIARDLHDAVGHHVALISVQAGALACTLDDEDLTQARESLAHHVLGRELTRRRGGDPRQVPDSRAPGLPRAVASPPAAPPAAPAARSPG
ncbi:histidine kinase [Kitasatospora sp. NPDC101155]|uniref:histidine kinase n=1 Tax=Kitasatospora sp. NPDC101155 TaxID=3364097 RepID=UPI00382C8B7C